METKQVTLAFALKQGISQEMVDENGEVMDPSQARIVKIKRQLELYESELKIAEIRQESNYSCESSILSLLSSLVLKSSHQVVGSKGPFLFSFRSHRDIRGNSMAVHLYKADFGK